MKNNKQFISPRIYYGEPARKCPYGDKGLVRATLYKYYGKIENRG
jgi:hypothetical protein